MRKILKATICFLLITALAQAQNIKGKVTDQNNIPLGNITATLHKAKDSSIAKIDVTKSNGEYSFTVVNGKYFIKFSGIGYAKNATIIFEVNDNYEVATVSLKTQDKSLSEVTVQSKKPMIEVRADKTIFNVEASINAVGSDAFELLRKSPGVMIDKDDNMQLAGKNGVQVYIDGRPSPLAGKDLANYLRSIQSNNIEAIEIITNPSSKYDAAGNAGILNIRLKKNKAYGTNGSVTANYGIGTWAKYNTGLNLNNRNKKWNLFGNYNYNISKNANSLAIYREITDTVFNQFGEMNSDNVSHNFKVGADFYATKQSTFGVIVDGNFNHIDMLNPGTTPIYVKSNGTGIRTLVADNSSTMKNNNINFNGNYKYTDTAGREVNIDLNYGNFDNNNNQLQPNYYRDFYTNANLFSRIYRMISPSKINIANGKIDYSQNLAGGKFETGVKISNVKSDNNFDRYDVSDLSKDIKTLDTLRSNRFIYKENVNAGYINFNKQLSKGMMFQVGLRVENSNITGTSTGRTWDNIGKVWKDYTSMFERNYTDFFPSAAITFNKNPMNQWSFSYSRRIDRPQYQQLNPFEFKLDENTYQKGNTNLTPQYTNTISVSNTYKYMLNTTLSYSHVTDMFAQLIDTTENSKSFITNKNLATQDIVNLSVSYPFQKGIYSAFFSVNAFYSKYKADFSNASSANRTIDLEATVANVYMQHAFEMGKGFKSEISSWFTTQQIAEGTLVSKPMGFVDIGISKTLFGGKGNLKMSVSDIFRTMRWQGSTNFTGQFINATFRWESQQFKVNFTYRFGKSSVKGARQRQTGAEDESKRTKGGGGLGG